MKLKTNLLGRTVQTRNTINGVANRQGEVVGVGTDNEGYNFLILRDNMNGGKNGQMFQLWLNPFDLPDLTVLD